jgi:hypothetical protein
MKNRSLKQVLYVVGSSLCMAATLEICFGSNHSILFLLPAGLQDFFTCRESL